MESTDRPEWAERLRRERMARGWSQSDAVHAMRTFSHVPLPGGLLDQWKRWEHGRNKPDEFYRSLIAATFGTVVESFFSTPRPAPLTGNAYLLSITGMDTHELIQRVRQSAIDNGTLDAIAVKVDELCCGYANRDPAELIEESREWLTRMTELLDRRLSFTQHRDVLDTAGTLALLVGCLEYDTGQKAAADATRKTALGLGNEAGNPNVIGWVHEMRAWFALTAGRYREVIEAAQAGQDAAADRSVSVQLLAQEAKAWARLGNRRNVTQALEKGRILLDSLPYPERPDNHFVVDPDKFDYYTMDCYRLIGDDQLAEIHAREIIRKSTAPDGTVIAPMRTAESTLTLGVVAARRGDLDQAITLGHEALMIGRKSKPSLLMVGAELDRVLNERFRGENQVRQFHEALMAATA
jgi:transcriptional regulator with XRE-family HTH domain/tetratricopeptide (TPR) repeat protein